jgi:hypothetical protein
MSVLAWKIRRFPWPRALAVTVCLAFTGCLPFDECDSGDQECRDDVPYACHPAGSVVSNARRWEAQEPCGGPRTCVVAGGTALCALSATPDPRCAAARDGEGCAGAQLLTCRSGYLTDETPCLSCSDLPQVACEGKRGSKCERDEECIDGLYCETRGSLTGCSPMRLCARTAECGYGEICEAHRGQLICETY